jgi:AP-2 complex subunit mu-1
MFTSSGLIVRFLKVFEKSNYHSIKWVRYLTKASGTYQIRVGRHEFFGKPRANLASPLPQF